MCSSDLKRAELIEKAHQDVAEIVEKGNQELERQKDTMLAEARSQIADLVVNASRKVVAGQEIAIDTAAAAKALEQK